MRTYSPIIGFLLVLLPSVSCALGPHEVIVLVNRNSRRSIRTANEFSRGRHVPTQNIIPLDIPDRIAKSATGISHRDFTRHIWTPVTKAVKARGIDDHILAWIYSLDFPVKINTEPPVSIQGITFTRNQLPDSDAITFGTYTSPFFAGPDSPRGRSFPAQSFDVLRAWLGESMPIPSMMLGFSGERGNSLERILSCIRTGIKSDSTAPTGTVFLVTGKDVRAKCRAWQFAAAQAEMTTMGVRSVILNAPPSREKGILGMLMGSPTVAPGSYGNYIPGAIAEHLTSLAAVFESAGQTKLSAWIEAGATASAGTVTEPMSNWRKFPNARLFVHYAAGCTAIEGLFQSVRCPLQILFVGEPLASPWSPRDTLKINGIDRSPFSGKTPVNLSVSSESDRTYTRFVFLIDGQTVQSGRSPAIKISVTDLSDGTHTLRAIAYGTGSVRNQIFAKERFEVRNSAK